MRTELASIQPRQVAPLNDVPYYEEQPAEPSIRRYVMFGLLSLVLFVGGSVYWSLSSKLDGAVVAPASFVVEGNRKGVEHIDGGVVRAIMVEDGAFVEAGQTLISFDSGEIDTDLRVLGNQLGELSVRRVRLISQITGQEVLTQAAVRSQIDGNLTAQHWSSAFATQAQLFDTQARARRTERQLSEQRVQGLRDQIDGLLEQRVSTQTQLGITRDQLTNLENLFEKGLVPSANISAARVDIERLNGSDAALRTQLAQVENQIHEIELTQSRQQRLFDEAAASELAAVEAQISVVMPQFLAAAERRNRVDILAPATGRVVNFDVASTGEVIRPGERILDIVPEGQTLIVEARISPADIDKLQIGQATRIRLSAFADANLPEALGEVMTISADALEDDRTGDAYYLARVRLNAEQPADVASRDLLPGMPADLFVQPGERTAFSYLTQPISERLAKTFIE